MVHDLVHSASYMAHGYSLLWKPWLVVLHASSDLLIFLAYFPRRHLDLPAAAILFAAFVFLCGLTHLVQMVTLGGRSTRRSSWRPPSCRSQPPS
jgi:hypothetical protein